ncbi:MAG: right-handed parallel beta-helix repeat-containing protein [Xanthomonadales bacterium]|jgi:hypothetical protein|nr:right-handed parallel beta-helix repeat-containing protein [Xanthomonadales bacterium]
MSLRSITHSNAGRLLAGIAAFVMLLPMATADSTNPLPELPRERVSLDVRSPGTVIRVGAGDNLQDALDDARPGDIVELEPGAEFDGPFVLRDKAVEAGEDGAEPWITVRTAAASGPLPLPGTRVMPGDGPAMARLVSGRNAVLRTEAGASHYRFIGIEFRRVSSWLPGGAGSGFDSLVSLDAGSDSANDTPHHFIFERCLFIGDPEEGTRRGMILNSRHTAVVDSHFENFMAQGVDAQAIVGWAGPGPFRIENNRLEGSGENVMFGGADPAIDGLVPSDIEIIGNHFTKPLAWRVGSDEFAGTRWTIKNLFELKNARRVLVKGNLFEHNWPESQNGFAVLFTVRNQEGDAPWSVVEDITFTDNVMRRVGSAINILGYDDIHTSRQTRRILIRNNLFDEVGEAWGPGDLFQLIDAADSVTIEDNTARHAGRILIGEYRPSERFRMEDNIVVHNRYGVVGSDRAPGTDALEWYFPDARFVGNMIVGGGGQSYPTDNEFPAAFPEDRLLPGAAPSEAVAESRYAAGANLRTLCLALSEVERQSVCAPVLGSGSP